jgi:hypothetical protein
VSESTCTRELNVPRSPGLCSLSRTLTILPPSLANALEGT